jgi:acetolactate synthase regulatory subunit
MTKNNHNETPVAHFFLICKANPILLERLLQTVRYRGFQVLNMSSNDLENGDTEVNFLVKGQAKLTTLKKSLETIIDVQQCYLTDDKAKLATLLEMGFSNMINPFISNTAQQQAVG